MSGTGVGDEENNVSGTGDGIEEDNTPGQVIVNTGRSTRQPPWDKGDMSGPETNSRSTLCRG